MGLQHVYSMQGLACMYIDKNWWHWSLSVWLLHSTSVFHHAEGSEQVANLMQFYKDVGYEHLIPEAQVELGMS